LRESFYFICRVPLLVALFHCTVAVIVHIAVVQRKVSIVLQQLSILSISSQLALFILEDGFNV
jgi:hypothetical protein